MPTCQTDQEDDNSRHVNTVNSNWPGALLHGSKGLQHAYVAHAHQLHAWLMTHVSTVHSLSTSHAAMVFVKRTKTNVVMNQCDEHGFPF